MALTEEDKKEISRLVIFEVRDIVTQIFSELQENEEKAYHQNFNNKKIADFIEKFVSPRLEKRLDKINGLD